MRTVPARMAASCRLDTSSRTLWPAEPWSVRRAGADAAKASVTLLPRSPVCTAASWKPPLGRRARPVSSRQRSMMRRKLAPALLSVGRDAAAQPCSTASTSPSSPGRLSVSGAGAARAGRQRRVDVNTSEWTVQRRRRTQLQDCRQQFGCPGLVRLLVLLF